MTAPLAVVRRELESMVRRDQELEPDFVPCEPPCRHLDCRQSRALAALDAAEAMLAEKPLIEAVSTATYAVTHTEDTGDHRAYARAALAAVRRALVGEG